MSRPRNKLARLPAEHRITVLRMLANGSGYEAVREQLRADGVDDADIPVGNRAFAAYMASAEYQDNLAQMLHGARRAARHEAIWQALEAGGGVQGVAKVALFEGMERILEALSDPDTDTTTAIRLIQAATSVNGVLVEQAKLALKQQAAEAKTAAEQGDDAPPALSGPELAAKMDELMGKKG